ncbi:hypothetical protein KsCSTR_23380 [Candidatus Kuenenia stuttgartiensis]|uniref:Uncharacterized protein n=1 Tax=Kuenenia stuttgartiensis TaxID=174633 RepID=Q1Q3L4_KUEST|nr:hypothetical protein KsCSTR_23380 [Candidatus Kuenenia stuttgartiensis]CAJ74606.1 unknown protein [Candidatus Kuenenia stuttgartiensis]
MDKYCISGYFFVAILTFSTLAVISLHTSIRQCVLFGKIFNGEVLNAKFQSSSPLPASAGEHSPPLKGTRGENVRICFVFRAMPV